MNIPLVNAASISATGPVSGSAQSTASITGDYTVWLEVVSMGASRLRIGIEDSADGTTWTPFQVWIEQSANTEHSRSFEAPGLKSNSARVNVYEIVGGSAVVNAWITTP